MQKSGKFQFNSPIRLMRNCVRNRLRREEDFNSSCMKYQYTCSYGAYNFPTRLSLFILKSVHGLWWQRRQDNYDGSGCSEDGDHATTI